MVQLKYHETGKESRVDPNVGQWNMINKVLSNVCIIKFKVWILNLGECLIFRTFHSEWREFFVLQLWVAFDDSFSTEKFSYLLTYIFLMPNFWSFQIFFFLLILETSTCKYFSLCYCSKRSKQQKVIACFIFFVKAMPYGLLTTEAIDMHQWAVDM